MSKDHKWTVLKTLPTDYTDYKGQVERWRHMDLSYPDCSWGCKWFHPLHDHKNASADSDWGVCTNLNSPRAGLLTWEHQAGFKCFESDLDDTTG